MREEARAGRTEPAADPCALGVGEEEDGGVWVDRELERIGLGASQRRLLAVCGGTQFADALELILVPFLPRALQLYEPAGSRLHIPGDSDAGASELAWTLSVALFAGMLVGAPLWGFAADRYGRKAGVCGTSASVGLFGLACSFATTPAALVAGRFLVGTGLGGASCALALYAECVPPSRRQEQLVLFFLCFSVGTALCALTAWLALGHFRSWRLLLRLACLPSLAVAAASASSLLPESPHFLATNGRAPDAARAVLKRLAAGNGVRAPQYQRRRGEELERRGQQEVEEEEEKAEIEGVERTGQAQGGVEGHQAETEALMAGERQTAPPAQSASSPLSAAAAAAAAEENVSGSIVALLCALFCGMAVVYYALVELSLQFLASASTRGPGATAAFGDAEFLQVVLVNAAELPGLLATVVVVRRSGSRASVSLMFAACACCCALMAGFVFAGIDAAAVATLLLFGARASALGFNQSLWIYSAAYFPCRRRAFGVGFVSAAARVGALLSPLVGQVVFAASPIFALAFCVAVCALASAASARLLPRLRVPPKVGRAV